MLLVEAFFLPSDKTGAGGGGSVGGSSLSHSPVRSLAEIFQKSKTCDKSVRERHTPFIQTVLVRHTMSLSIQNRAFVFRSSTESARFCQLLWLLKCESKKIKKSLSLCYCLCSQCSGILVWILSLSPSSEWYKEEEHSKIRDE